LSEISQLRRGDVETVKAFLSRQFDRYRPPYGRTTVTVPRQCSFIGTTNSGTYLKDVTGNRRFWPVRLTKISLASIEADRDQIWAEAVAAYDSGEKWWLSPEIEKIAVAEQSERLVVDPWTDDIAKYIAARAGPFTTADILTRVIDKKKDRQDRADEMRVAEIFATLGLVRKRRRGGAQRSYQYVKPEQPSLPEINEGQG
jgi:putative DNA primase/helicase